ncbi:MAG TPA: translation initiation factor IF-2 N-terminal domain-containing protein [Candidatus Kryptobacter bacterium]|nr:translation initiation factor IF-2 N-terminal domain-containing protein [Candidatus Kryptobacter bacterium]
MTHNIAQLTESRKKKISALADMSQREQELLVQLGMVEEPEKEPEKSPDSTVTIPAGEPVKVHVLAKALNTSNKELIEQLQAIGVDVNHHMNDVSPEDIKRLFPDTGGTEE